MICNGEPCLARADDDSVDMSVSRLVPISCPG